MTRGLRLVVIIGANKGFSPQSETGIAYCVFREQLITTKDTKVHEGSLRKPKSEEIFFESSPHETRNAETRHFREPVNT